MRSKRIVNTQLAMRCVVLSTAIIAMGGAGCTEGQILDEMTGIQSSRQALTANQARVLGFETPLQDWSTTNGEVSLGIGIPASQGSAALSVLPNGWTEISSVPIASLGAVKGTAAIDIRLPEQVGWGEVRIIFVLPSQNIGWREVGSQSLTGLTANVYRTLSFPLDASTVSLLSGAYSDLIVKVVVNAPRLSTPYLLDNLVLAEQSTPDTDSEMDTASDTENECPNANQNADILDFEVANYWSPTNANVQHSSIHTHGNYGLGVSGGGWMELLSAPLSTLNNVDNTIAVSLRLPAVQPNPSWYGQAALLFDLPSQGIHHQWIGERSLTGLPLETFNTLEFELPPAVVTALHADYCDLRLKLVLNVPSNASGQYIFDAIRFETTDTPPTILLGTDKERPRENPAGFTTKGDSLVLIGQIVDDGGVASESMTLNGNPIVLPPLGSDGEFETTLSLLYDESQAFTSNTIEVTATDFDGNTSTVTVRVDAMSPRLPGEVVVLFDAGANEADRIDALAEVNGVIRTSMSERMKLIEVPVGTELQAFTALIEMKGVVRAAMPNFPLFPTRTEVNDSGFPNQWNLERIFAPEAWDYAFGSDDIIVGVLDSGIKYDWQYVFIGPPCEYNSGGQPIMDNDAPLIDNIWINEDECCLAPPCESLCHPILPQDNPDTCPKADLNGDGCPGTCGVDDDGDGLADMADPDVKLIYTNGRDDDGDGIIDEQGPGGVSCATVTPSQMQNAISSEDCDGAANDDDENGYPDDCRGFQFARLQGPLEDYVGALHAPNDPSDLLGGGQWVGHGTDAAATLGEIGDNCTSFSGVAPRVKMMPLAVGRYILEADGTRSLSPYPTLFAILEAYEYAAENGALITSASVRDTCTCEDQSPDECAPLCPWGVSLSLEDAKLQFTLLMAETASQHVIHVVGAGNDYLNVDIGQSAIFPVHVGLPNMLTVAASDINDFRVDYSNYGLSTISIAAPGEDLPFFSGTSAAAPHVAGSAVLLLEAIPELRGDPTRATRQIMDSATKLVQWTNLVKAGGIVNAAAAITNSLVVKTLFSDVSYNHLTRAGRDLQTNDVDLFDVDNDGDLDLLELPCDGRGNVANGRLLINDGTGRFEDRSRTQWSPYVISHCDAKYGDIDGDGDLDVVAAGFNEAQPNSAPNQNQIYINNGMGFFSMDTVGRLPMEQVPTRAISLCDVDGDGDLDLFAGDTMANPDAKSNRLYINNGVGVYTEETDARLLNVYRPDLGAPTKIVCAELFRPATTPVCDPISQPCRLCSDPTLSIDGLVARGLITDADTCHVFRRLVQPEIVVAGSQGSLTRLFANQGDGLFMEATDRLHLPATGFGRQEQDVEAADFDGDGDLDLMFVTAIGARNFLLMNDGIGDFFEAPAQPMTTDGDWAREVEVADFDLDGDMDIVVFRGDPNADKPGYHSYYRNDGFSLFSEIEVGLDTLYLVTTDGEVGDIDNDGDVDLIVGNHGAMNQVLINNIVSM